MTATTADAAPRSVFPKAAPDGLIASVLLSFLATAGLFYVNIMAALVAGLIHGLQLSDKTAGFVASANVYGAALGALVAVFLVKRMPWRPTAVNCLLLLIGIDLASTFITNGEALIATRFVHGTIGGFLVGTGFSVIARTASPDKTFGMLLVVQYGFGGLGAMYLPGLVPAYGPEILFFALAAFSAITFLMVPFIADYPVRAPDPAVPANAAISWTPLIFTLIAIFLFQAGNMLLGAYIFELGRHYGLAGDFMSNAVGWATWIGMLGSVFVVVMGTRFGRFVPLVIAMIVTVIGNYAFRWSGDPNIYAGANVVTGVTWAFVIPYLFGMCAAFDKAGQTAALGGFFSKMGLASGPLAAALLVGDGNYPFLVDIAAVALAASAALALIPAYLLDRRSMT